MTDTRVSVLTPPGTGAIATVAVVGPRAWEQVRAKFRPAKGVLPESPPLHRFWFGNLGDGPGDEVIVAVKRVEPEVQVEIHCHGGRRVVRWVVEQFEAVSAPPQQFPPGEPGADPRALDPLTRASTTRTASILLDQYHGAFKRAVDEILADLPNAHSRLARLAALAPLGQHLIEPWKVVIAGPPNVGKSTLVNALAGYQRSVVAPIPGTTRDVVTARLAFDGWPVELADTAGLRETAEALEAAGIGLARTQLAAADLIVWVTDQTDPNPVWPPVDFGGRLQLVVNKCDRPSAWPTDFESRARDAVRVSAETGDGIPALIAGVVGRMVPVTPEPGEEVPFTPELAGRIEQAHAAVTTGNLGAADEHLRSCLP